MIIVNEFRATKGEYVDALVALVESDIQSVDTFLEILRFHYKQESRKTTAGRIAEHLGYKNANGVIGMLAKFIGKQLNFDKKLPKRLDGSTQWYRVISFGRSGSSETLDNHFEYEMIPELAEALEHLGLV